MSDPTLTLSPECGRAAHDPCGEIPEYGAPCERECHSAHGGWNYVGEVAR